LNSHSASDPAMQIPLASVEKLAIRTTKLFVWIFRGH